MLRCGLLGRTLGHSYSPQIHSMLSDYEYKLYEKEPDELDSFLRSGSFDGLNVTIPYKKSVIDFCAELSDTARAVGSVNTLVRRTDGTLFGDNTDAFGFENLARRSGAAVTGCKAVILGSGGTSATARFVLEKLGAREITVISRRGEDNYENISRHSDADILINTTPVGTFPNNGEKAVDLRVFSHLSAVFDVVYNPMRSALLLQAEELEIPCECGLHMLVCQAKRSSELFTGSSISDEVSARIEKLLSRQMQNIVLIGMPGCGKSVVAKKLAQALGRTAADSDLEITRRERMSIPEIFAKPGESRFRAVETAVLSDLGKRGGLIISTGGGCVTRDENYPLLHQNSTIVWIQRETSRLAKAGRPLSEHNDMDEMYNERRPMYERFADIIVDNNGSIDDTVRSILEAIE